jgi:hypothetical protein
LRPSSDVTSLGSVCSSLTRVSLSRLIGLGPHDILDSVFHFCQVVSSPVEFLDPYEVEGINYQVRLDLNI